MVARARPLRCVPLESQFLRDAGVVGIYGPGSNIVECAANVLCKLGCNMPPEGLSEAAA